MVEFISRSYSNLNDKGITKMDAYLEEEIQNPDASDFEAKKQKVSMIGKELYADGGTDTMENMFYSIEFRIKEEIGKEGKQYRSWWNDISNELKY